MPQFTKRSGILFGIAFIMALIVLLRGGDGKEGVVEVEPTATVMERLADSDETVARQAAIDLGRMRATISLEPLSECLREHTHPKVRVAAARALRRIDTWDAIPVLIEGMNDSDFKVRSAANASVIDMIGQDWQFDPAWDTDDREDWLEQFAEYVDKERGGWESWQKRRTDPFAPGAGTPAE